MASKELNNLANGLIPQATVITLHKCNGLQNRYRSRALKAKLIFDEGIKFTPQTLTANALGHVRARDGLPAAVLGSNVAAMPLGMYGDAGTQFGIDTMVPHGARDTSTYSRLHMRRSTPSGWGPSTPPRSRPTSTSPACSRWSLRSIA